jgi:hypothetical protein
MRVQEDSDGQGSFAVVCNLVGLERKFKQEFQEYEYESLLF